MYRRNSDKRPNDAELQDLEPGVGEDFRSVPMGSHNSLDIGAEVYRDNQAQNRRSRRWIVIFVSVVALLGVSAIVLGVRCAPWPPAEPLGLQNFTTTMFTTESITRYSTKFRTETSTRIQPTTVTVTSIVVSTQAVTTTRMAKTSLVTAIIATTLYLTPTQTTSELTSTTASSLSKPRCIPPGLYGGEELHQVSSDYDILLAGNLEYAASHGLDIGSQDMLSVALRSIFTCVAREDVILAAVCETAFVRTDSTILCDGAEYALSSSQLPATNTSFLSSRTPSTLITTPADSTSIAPITMTRTTNITVPWSPGPSGASVAHKADEVQAALVH